MKVNTNSINGWAMFDAHSVANTKGGVSHSASIVQDFRAMGEDVLHAAIPVDRTAELTYQGAKHAGFGGAVLGFILGMLWDIGEVLMVVPSLIWKSLNVVGHAGAEVVNLVQGEHDGTATGAQEFLWEQPPSFVIQTGAWIAGSSPINQYALNKPTGSGVALNKATDKA